jgi:hypothetical protein
MYPSEYMQDTCRIHQNTHQDTYPATQHIRELTAAPTRALRAKVREMVGTAMCTGYLRLFAGSTSMAESAAAKAGLIGVGVGGRPKRFCLLLFPRVSLRPPDSSIAVACTYTPQQNSHMPSGSSGLCSQPPASCWLHAANLPPIFHPFAIQTAYRRPRGSTTASHGPPAATRRRTLCPHPGSTVGTKTPSMMMSCGSATMNTASVLPRNMPRTKRPRYMYRDVS